MVYTEDVNKKNRIENCILKINLVYESNFMLYTEDVSKKNRIENCILKINLDRESNFMVYTEDVSKKNRIENCILKIDLDYESNFMVCTDVSKKNRIANCILKIKVKSPRASELKVICTFAVISEKHCGIHVDGCMPCSLKSKDYKKDVTPVR